MRNDGGACLIWGVQGFAQAVHSGKVDRLLSVVVMMEVL